MNGDVYDLQVIVKSRVPTVSSKSTILSHLVPPCFSFTLCFSALIRKCQLLAISVGSFLKVITNCKDSF
jgi:hypothetical protein